MILVTLLCVASTPALAQKLPVPVHPDTLPTLIRSWSLPASLAPYVTNAYAPRFTLSGALLFVFDHNGRRLVAVDATNGNVKWQAPVPCRSENAFAFTPLVYRSRVFVACDGYMYSFDALNGRLKWKLGTKGVPTNGLGRSKHRLYLPYIRVVGKKAQPGVHIWAIDSRRAQVEWSKKFPGQMGYVMGDSDGVYLVTNIGVTLGLTPDRGEPKWQVRVKGDVKSPPLLDHSKLYITTLQTKAGWQGTGVFVVDVRRGRLLWKSKLSHPMVHKFMYGKQLATVDGMGRLTVFDKTGKKATEINLGFSDEPTSLLATAVKNRVFVFSSHADGNGYIRLVDMDKKKVLVAANALDMKARALTPAGKLLFIDGEDGDVYCYRLDKSQRPKRLSVPPQEFAREMLVRAQKARGPVRGGVAAKLAGLGPKALPAIEPSLESSNPFVVTLAARAIALLKPRRSVPPLLKAFKRLSETPPQKGKHDPLLAVINALAQIRDGRANKDLQKLLKDEPQGHMRRRAAFVALGSIGSPAALGPVWTFKGANQLTTSPWEPMAFTPSYDYKVEDDVTTTIENWPPEIRQATSRTVQTKTGEVYTATLSPYLGGYNDIWIGKSDLDGVISTPLFTGLTKPETEPNRRIRINSLKVNDKAEATLTIEFKRKDKWVKARPVEIPLRKLMMDRDGDKLPDIVERRLHLAITNEDSDGDGVRDSEDINPLASGKVRLTPEQKVYREAFFTYFAFLKRRGLVVVDAGEAPSIEYYGRRDPVLSLRRSTIVRFRQDVGLHAVDFVTFGGPYPAGAGFGDALPEVEWNKRKTWARVGMDILRSGENAVAYNVTLKRVGRNWVVSEFKRVWTTNK
jgi:outer membrane protein assembly factor BamB